MEYKEIITLHGPCACGKSSISQILQDYFPTYCSYSTGTIARDMAKKAGMEMGEYILHVRDRNIPYDAILDDSLRKLNDGHTQWIVDSRLGYLFIPASFKVYLKVDPATAAERRLEQLQRKDVARYGSLTVSDVFSQLQERDRQDKKKYVELYDTDCSDEKNYDLIVDNNGDRVTVAAGEIILKYIAWCKKYSIGEYAL